MPRVPLATVQFPPATPANTGGAGDAVGRLEWCALQYPNSDFVSIICGVRNLAPNAEVSWVIQEGFDIQAVGPTNLGVLHAKGSPGAGTGTVTPTVNGTALEPILVVINGDDCFTV